MSVLPSIGIGQARQLAGKTLRTGNRAFVFGSEDTIKLGGQAIALPLFDKSGRRVAFFRSSLALGATSDKIDRTSWLIGQKLHLKNEAFAAAPQLWFNSKIHGRPDGIAFDVAATIHGCAPGRSWKDWKEQVEFGNAGAPTVDQRLKFARSLVQRLASLEAFGRNGFLHGDLSDGNIMLDADSGLVHLIDFDCFVFDSPTLSKTRLHVDEGGSKGTPSYMPPHLEEETSLHVGPVSDRFARDMLLIELLAFQPGDPIDTSPLYWTGQKELLADSAELARSLQMDHLLHASVFSLQESERPSSFKIASRISVNVEDNTNEMLDAAPWLPSQINASSENRSSNDSQRKTLNQASLAESPLEVLFESLKSKSTETLRRSVASFKANSLSVGHLAAWAIAASSFVLLMLYMVYRCLFLISFPANFIAAFVFLAGVAWLGSVTGIWKYFGFQESETQ